MISAFAVEGLPEVRAGTDLGALIVDTIAQSGALPLDRTDIVAIAHKVVSKAEGRVRALAEVLPTLRAVELAAAGGRDPRHVQVVLDESREIVREAPGVIVCETRHGFVCANAGVDQSNVPGEDAVLMLPLDPDGSARAIRARIHELTGVSPGVLISDSFGRAWRTGQADVAIGLAGVTPLEDWRGSFDAYGREMQATVIAVGDLLAGMADLARRKNAAQPVVVLRGVECYVTTEDGPGVAPLLRERSQDLFR